MLCGKGVHSLEVRCVSAGEKRACGCSDIKSLGARFSVGAVNDEGSARIVCLLYELENFVCVRCVITNIASTRIRCMRS